MSDPGNESTVARSYLPVEEMEVYRRFTEVANSLWKLVHRWPAFAKETIGKQLICAADSIGANLVEGDGRHSDAEAAHFFLIARGSARETRHWLRCARERELLAQADFDGLMTELTAAARQLNRRIEYRRSCHRHGTICELPSEYEIVEQDPFIDP